MLLICILKKSDGENVNNYRLNLKVCDAHDFSPRESVVKHLPVHYLLMEQKKIKYNNRVASNVCVIMASTDDLLMMC